MGADAARRRPGCGRARLEPARLGSADRQDPSRRAAAQGKSAARDGAIRPPVDDEKLFDIVEVLDAIAAETGRTVPQIAINWLLGRPTVSSVIIGARNEEQLRQNLDAVGWSLSKDQIERLDAVSAVTAPYPHFPYRRQEGFARLNPPIA